MAHRRSAWLRRIGLLCLSLLLSVALHAQSTGSVTGRVLCADTHGPARMAGVYLVPVVEPSPTAPKPSAAGARSNPPATVTHIVETGLDGSFAIPDVRPGNYYVVAEKRGYIAPLTVLSREQLNKPDKAAADLMARLLTPATVSPGRATRVEATVLRGATISGTVRFDDGVPVVSTGVTLARKGWDGKWAALPLPMVASEDGTTDDQGRFRISGLPEGEYRLHTSLSLGDTEVSRSGESSSMSSSKSFSLEVYFDASFRPSTAKSLKLADGEERSAVDLVIPLSTLHTLSGAVLRGGRVVNAAQVALLWSDTKEELTSTTVRPEDDSFHFDYVPEGDFILRVTEARDVTRTEVPNCPAGSVCAPPTHTEEKVLQRFGSADQPLSLHTDLQAINVAVPAGTAGSPEP